MIDFLTANWLWIVVVGAFVLMHTRRGGCGMHAGHSDHGHRDSSNETSRHPDREDVA